MLDQKLARVAYYLERDPYYTWASGQALLTSLYDEPASEEDDYSDLLDREEREQPPVKMGWLRRLLSRIG